MPPGRRSRRQLTALAAIALASSLLSSNGLTAGVLDDALSLIGATVPGAPRGVTAEPGNGQVTVRWDEPADAGGTPIISYTVSAFPGGRQVTTTDGRAREARITGLANGAAYTLAVHASNAVGSGPSALANLIEAGAGYWLGADDGAVFAFGSARHLGAPSGPLNRPVVGIAATPSGAGYWLVASDGGLFAFGDASFHGSLGAIPLNKPVVGMTATPSGAGYWLVASDGGLFAFGDAAFHGSLGAIPLNKPVVGMTATPSGAGYWLIASDGGLFAFGDAGFHGSLGAIPLNKPIMAMAATTTRQGYWLVANDGGVFAFGDAGFHGSLGGRPLAAPIVGMASPSDAGYLLAAQDGGVFAFGSAEFLGSPTGRRGNIAGIAIAVAGGQVVPLGAPGRPTNVSPAQANRCGTTVRVTWGPPTDDGGTPVTQYVVSASDGTVKTVSGGTTSAVFDNLAAGRQYTFIVTARNAVGLGQPSPPSSPIAFLTPPGRPTGVVADSPQDRSAQVSWNPPSDRGGGPIQRYTVTAYVGGAVDGTTTVGGGTTQVRITGLENGTGYTFTVLAANEDCDGPSSGHSDVVTPKKPSGPSGPSGPSDPSDPSSPS